MLDTFLKIQALGVRIVFDDFGTGYASLSYLKKFPLDGLKIDRSFVLELLADSDDAAIVGSTIGLSRQLGLSVIAEGIENRATADLLVSMGCEEGQGYFFGRPMPAADFRPPPKWHRAAAVLYAIVPGECWDTYDSRVENSSRCWLSAQHWDCSPHGRPSSVARWAAMSAAAPGAPACTPDPAKVALICAPTSPSTVARTRPRGDDVLYGSERQRR